MSKLENRWIKAAWRRKTLKVENAVVSEAWTTMEGVGVIFKFTGYAIQLGGERIEQELKPTWNRMKTAPQKGAKQMRIETYQFKMQQSRFFREWKEECYLWLTQNIHT